MIQTSSSLREVAGYSFPTLCPVCIVCAVLSSPPSSHTEYSFLHLGVHLLQALLCPELPSGNEFLSLSSSSSQTAIHRLSSNRTLLLLNAPVVLLFQLMPRLKNSSGSCQCVTLLSVLLPPLFLFKTPCGMCNIQEANKHTFVASLSPLG